MNISITPAAYPFTNPDAILQRCLTYSAVSLVATACLLATFSIISLTHLRLFSGGKKRIIIFLSALSLMIFVRFTDKMFRLKKGFRRDEIKKMYIFPRYIPILYLSLSLFSVCSLQTSLGSHYFSIISKANLFVSVFAFSVIRGLSSLPVEKMSEEIISSLPRYQNSR